MPNLPKNRLRKSRLRRRHTAEAAETGMMGGWFVTLPLDAFIAKRAESVAAPVGGDAGRLHSAAHGRIRGLGRGTIRPRPTGPIAFLLQRSAAARTGACTCSGTRLACLAAEERRPASRERPQGPSKRSRRSSAQEFATMWPEQEQLRRRCRVGVADQEISAVGVAVAVCVRGGKQDDGAWTVSRTPPRQVVPVDRTVTVEIRRRQRDGARALAGHGERRGADVDDRVRNGVVDPKVGGGRRREVEVGGSVEPRRKVGGAARTDAVKRLIDFKRPGDARQELAKAAEWPNGWAGL